MKAALRDAKRAEAIQLRPSGSTMAYAASGASKKKQEARCASCNAEMVSLGGRATTGICIRCTDAARRARREVQAQRDAHARSTNDPHGNGLSVDGSS